MASDKQSASLDPSEIAKLLQANDGKAELYLDWKTTQYPTFAGRDIYLSGSESLRRIRNIVATP